MEQFGISQETADALYADGISLAVAIALRIIGALFFYFIVKIIVKKLLKGLKRFLERRDDSPSLNEFIYGFAKLML